LRSKVVFIDSGVEDPTALLAGIHQDATVVEIDRRSDGVQQIADYLAASGQTYNAVHIVSHGAKAALQLGNGALTADNIDAYAEQLKTIGNAIAEDGDLLLYGCAVASGDGERFVAALAQATGADVAASNDLTGHRNLGGDWQLEVSTGVIDSTVPFNGMARNAFVSTLDVLRGTTSNDTIDGLGGDDRIDGLGGDDTIKPLFPR
jgi:Ca2+-binding RTX toxin-like protein